MQSLIDAAGLAHASVIFRSRIVVTAFQFFQRNFVWRVTVNFVGAHEDKNSVRAVLARCLKQNGPRPGDTRTEGLERLKSNYEESAYLQLKTVLQPEKQ